MVKILCTNSKDNFLELNFLISVNFLSQQSEQGASKYSMILSRTCLEDSFVAKFLLALPGRTFPIVSQILDQSFTQVSELKGNFVSTYKKKSQFLK